MSELDKLLKELMSSGKAGQLQNIAKSPEVANLGKMIDTQALKKAAASGDQAALSDILRKVLSTEEGKALMKKVGDNFGD